MLFKSDTLTAQEARLALANPIEPDRAQPDRAQPDRAQPDRTGAPAGLDARPVQTQIELDLANLRHENANLQQQLTTLRREMEAQLAATATQARLAAQEQYQADDAARLAAMEQALDSAHAEFVRHLREAGIPLALAAARTALEQLVRPHLAELDWLERSITCRMARVADQAAVRIELSSSAASDLTRLLREQLDRRVRFGVDPELPEGAARIRFAMGEAAVDPAAGLARMLAALAQDATDE